MSDDDPIRPDRRALLELDALLERIEALRDGGGRERFDADDVHRWALHRLWIAVGNEAALFAGARGFDVRQVEPSARLYQNRNYLAHLPLTEIDDNELWRTTVLRTSDYRTAVRRELR